MTRLLQLLGFHDPYGWVIVDFAAFTLNWMHHIKLAIRRQPLSGCR